MPTKKGIRAVIFDLGGVIVKHKLSADIGNKKFLVARPGGIEWEKSGKAIELLGLFERGLISPEQFYSSALPFMKKKMPFGQFAREWVSIFEPQKKVIGVLRRLHQAGYKVGIVSNCNILAYNWIMENCGLRPFVSVIVPSWRAHVMKPERKIFEIALKELNEKPENCVFIDDVERCVAGAERVGMKGVHFRNPLQLQMGLKKLRVGIKPRRAQFGGKGLRARAKTVFERRKKISRARY